MIKRCLLQLIAIIFCFVLFSCSVTINPNQSKIIVIQDSVEIINKTGEFDFGDVHIGSQKTVSFKIYNIGDDVLNLTNNPPIIITDDDNESFSVNSIGMNRLILPNIFTAFTITYSPRNQGHDSAIVRIPSNSVSKNPYTFKIVGTGLGTSAEICVKQLEKKIENGTGIYNFGIVNVNTLTDSIVFTIENTGSSDLELTGSQSKIEVIGNDASMFFVNESSTNSVIHPSQSTSFSISFKPTTVGFKSIEISISNNDSDDNPFCFTIIGSGAIAPEINVKNGSTTIYNGSWKYDFGDVDLNTPSTNLMISIENVGSSYLRLLNFPKSVTVSGTDKNMFHVDQTKTKEILLPGESTSFYIVFIPTDIAKKTATISIANTDSNENPFTFAVEGKGVFPEINVKQGTTNIPCTTGSYDFGSTEIGSSSGNIIFTIENSGSALLKLTGNPIVSKFGTDKSMFIVSDSATSIQISPNSSTTFTISFSPTSLGLKTAKISIANNDADENPYVFEIKGTGTDFQPGTAIGWIGGGSNGWKTGYAPNNGTDYQSFYYPQGVCLDNLGYIYVAERYNHRISKWDINGNAIGWIGGGSDGWKQTSNVSSGVDYRSFKEPRGVHVDVDGNIYVADTRNHRICKWDKNGTAIGWIGNGQNGWSKIDNNGSGNVDYKSFESPHGVFVDSSDNIYVADTFNHRISKWDKYGYAIGWIGGGSDGWKTSSSLHNDGSDYKSFDEPYNLFITPNGDLYIADMINSRISKWNSSGYAIGWIGGGSNGWKTGTSSHNIDYQSFSAPYSVFISSAGYIYVTDTGNERICKWTISGNAIGWIGGGYEGWQTISKKCSYGTVYNYFNEATSVALGSDGKIYVADHRNNRISKWND